ncbi:MULTISPECIES: hypothetical protein [Brevundimonas]|jgi:hypothetical protein|uniref:hypothetical protein n=1 Tax=Brevundimonas TaxID=41275 RepID=UPI0006D07320|nr:MULTISPECIES: hypothetical protein [Brevundimonas]ALJ09204.1 hypothetical protein JL11_13315 [Brevundimonas sp. DS20]MAL58328.1 hypothetical protein [Brevundimonas sp.]MBJ7509707.1 hypothetical protein [Brevundimonas sp.]MCC4293135.1 hypothetical protein [Brevundimonas aurantiaca]QFU32550.1 hypothetical protein BSP_12870 [Brevundimonas sp. Bb-A]
MQDANAKQDASTDTPHAKRVEPREGKPDQLEHRVNPEEGREEALIDESVEETFPASDPISPKHIT